MKPEQTDTTPVGRLAENCGATLQTDEDLVVVSWNVHKGVDPGLPAELVRLVHDRKPHILALQESRPDLALPAGFAGHHATSFRRGLVGPEEGVMTIASAPITLAHRVRSSERELMVLTPKAALITLFPLSDGRSLCLINVHGLNFDPSGKQLARQLAELRSLVEHIDGPLIVAGDFNTWNEPRMTAVLDLAHALDLFEVYPDYPGGKKGHAPSKTVRKAIKIDRRLHLDRLYVRGLRTVHAAWLEHYECSDHVALVTRLAWT